jgi:hypothetical protein
MKRAREETQMATEVVIDGRTVGQIAVASILPAPPSPSA